MFLKKAPEFHFDFLTKVPWSNIMSHSCCSIYIFDSFFTQIHIIELGPHISGNTALSSYSEQLYFDESDRFDFPVSIQVSISEVKLLLPPQALHN